MLSEFRTGLTYIIGFSNGAYNIATAHGAFTCSIGILNGLLFYRNVDTRFVFIDVSNGAYLTGQE